MADQIFWLLLLSLPVACVSWTVTHEEIFREPRVCLEEWSRAATHWWQRKFCYALTCEYCLSHYVAAGFVALADFWLLISDWRGYLIAWLSVVAIANVYMSAFGRLRVEIRKSKADATQTEKRSRLAG